MTKGPLVVVGSVNADLVMQVERIPKPGETLAASTLEFYPGGKGANQAAAAAKLGYATYFVGQIGDDANAVPLKDSLVRCGVNISHLKDLKGSTGTAIILLQTSGENSIIIVGGANQAQWQLSDATKQLLKTAGAILLQREIPESVNTEVAEIAASAGVPVILDAGGVEGPISPALLRNVSVLSPNETELARLTGLPTENMDQVKVAAEHVMAMGVKSVLVKLGADGCLLLPGSGEPVRQLAFKAAKVVDTTGAGDCFTASYGVAVLEGRGLVDALKFASAAAAICVQRKGAQPSLPSRDEVEALLREQS